MGARATSPPVEPLRGLTRDEAARLLSQDGPNELPSAGPRGPLRALAGVVREPMLLLLLASGAVYLVLGDIEEALALVAAIFVVIGITF